MENAADLLAKVLPAAGLDDAVLDAIVLSSCADGLAKGELSTVTELARRLPSLRDSSKDDVDARVRTAFERVEATGLEETLRGLADQVKGDDARKQVFTAAVIVQLADGHVTNEENAFLLDLADVLGLDETHVRKIRSEIEAVLAKPK
jgi:tellurite resistance protein